MHVQEADLRRLYYAKHNEDIKWHFINWEEKKKKKKIRSRKSFAQVQLTFGINVKANLNVVCCNVVTWEWDHDQR